MAERDDLPVEEMRGEGAEERTSSNGGMIAGFVLGALVGAGLALLLAPDSGQETRRSLRRHVRAMRKDAIPELERAAAHARRRLRRGRRGLRDRRA